MNSELLKDPLVIAGLAIGLAMKAFDLVKTTRYRSSQMNGANPVVNAVNNLRDAILLQKQTCEANHQRTREELRERETREVKRLDDVAAELRRHP